jgi:protein-tyrosine phosphatase
VEDSTEVRSRNRYSNVSPWESNRVHLNVPEAHCDYINASPIALKSRKDGSIKQYIATQVCDSYVYTAQYLDVTSSW